MKRIIALFTWLVILAVSCEDPYKVADPVFDVQVPETVIAGKPFNFTFTGRADIMTFYSGEQSHNYDFAQKERYGTANVKLIFTTSTGTKGIAGHPNPSSLPLSISTDFDENYTQEGLEKATWSDISGYFAFPTDRNMKVSSGKVDISSLFPDKDTPIYFCFKYEVQQYQLKANTYRGNPMPPWSLNSFEISRVHEDNENVTYDMTGAGWHLVKGQNFNLISEGNLPSLPVVSTGSVLLQTDSKPANTTTMWIVSSPIYSMSEINLGRDTGISIKESYDIMRASYQYQYNEAGEYSAVFVAANSNFNGRKETVKKITVNVINEE